MQEGKKAIRIVVNLDEEVYRRLKHAVIDAGRPLNDVVREFLLKWLAEQERRSVKGSRRGGK